MAATIRVPEQFKSLVGGVSKLHLPGSTIGALLSSLCDKYPEIRPKIFNKHGEKRKTVNIYLNKEDIRYLDGLQTPVGEEDEVIILPPASGG